MYPLGYMKLFMASNSITEVKQRLARFYSDGGRRTIDGCICQLKAAFTFELIILFMYNNNVLKYILFSIENLKRLTIFYRKR